MFWLIAQPGRDADWVRNIEANPRVRVKVSGGNWLTGTAHILDDDDPAERVRILSEANFPRRLCMSTSEALHTNALHGMTYLGGLFAVAAPSAEVISALG